MKKPLKCIITGIYIFFSLTIYAQDTNVPGQMENIIESIIDDIEENADLNMLVEDIENLAENPVNINSAGPSQLSRLHLLDDIQIQKLIEYRDLYGPFYSKYELGNIEGFTKNLIEKMVPFISFGIIKKKPSELPEKLKSGKHQLLLRTLRTIQKPRGYQEREDGTIPFEGNRARYYVRYGFRSGDDISAGLTAEKDPGEAFFSGSNKNGFDFYSVHLSLKISPLFENLTIGDYIVRAGQGLTIWQGFSTGKSVSALNISKTNQGIRPYTSTDENRFFRGIATTINKGASRVSMFYSQKNSDANLVFPDSTDNHFSSLQTSGYHRTVHEIADKNSINDLNTGFLWSLRFTNLKIGATFLYRIFDMPFIRADQLYNLFRFQGKTNIVTGTDYLFSKGKYQLFGEAAISKSKKLSFIQGVTAHIHDQLNLSLLLRHFDKNYHALWGSAFSEASAVINETGLYTGIHILPLKFVKVSAYLDLFRSEWINYTTTAPSTGKDLQVQTDVRFSKKISFYIRYKSKSKDKKSKEKERYIISPEQYKKTRLHFQYSPSKILTLKTRMEHVQYKSMEKENGWLVFQDIQLSQLKNIPLNLSARLAWFNSDSYYSRIYAYENDLLYTFSIPAYFDKGFRTYLNLKFKINEKTEIWLKLANTTLIEAETIGSGYNEIQGNKKSEVKFQMRLKI